MKLPRQLTPIPLKPTRYVTQPTKSPNPQQHLGVTPQQHPCQDPNRECLPCTDGRQWCRVPGRNYPVMCSC
jgi:hypothetical protein